MYVSMLIRNPSHTNGVWIIRYCRPQSRFVVNGIWIIRETSVLLCREEVITPNTLDTQCLARYQEKCELLVVPNSALRSRGRNQVGRSLHCNPSHYT